MRWGITENDSPHPITSSLSRFQQERDNCVLETHQLQAEIRYLEEKLRVAAKRAEKEAAGEQEARKLRANLAEAREKLMVVQSKLEALERLVQETREKKRDVDEARDQYKKRLALRDERRQMLDSIKEQIDKLRIIQDELEASGVAVRADEEPAEGEIVRPGRRLSKQEIMDKLANLQRHRLRVQRDLDAAERSLEDVRTRWGISDLEQRSYPHPITSRLSRLQEERDNCVVEASRLEASIGILEKKYKAADDSPKKRQFEANLEKTRDELILLQSKLERLEQMVDDAEAKKKELDSACAQYKQRLAIRDERRKMLDSINEQIEKFKIIHDDPQISEVPVAPDEEPAEGEMVRPGRRLSRQEIADKLVSLDGQRVRIERDMQAAEEAMEEVRRASGYTDLEERSYPHPVTSRVIRLERQRDDCLLEIAQHRAKIENLEKQAGTDEGKANLEKARQDLRVSVSKFEELREMCDEAGAQKRDLDTARVQYKKRASTRDERKRMLDSVKAEIERLKILYDDPATPEKKVEVIELR